LIGAVSGAIAGFLASRLLSSEHVFDDHDHFHNVVYGDDTKEVHEAARENPEEKYVVVEATPSKA